MCWPLNPGTISDVYNEASEVADKYYEAIQLTQKTFIDVAMSQAWIFLTVGLGLSLLVGVVVTVLVLCCLAWRNKRREER